MKRRVKSSGTLVFASEIECKSPESCHFGGEIDWKRGSKPRLKGTPCVTTL